MDVFISMLTNGKITRDNVGPHGDLLPGFPYVGAPHEDRSKARREVTAISSPFPGV
jgi:hypothetical protein